jgi:hypothetical protein
MQVIMVCEVVSHVFQQFSHAFTLQHWLDFNATTSAQQIWHSTMLTRLCVFLFFKAKSR